MFDGFAEDLEELGFEAFGLGVAIEVVGVDVVGVVAEVEFVDDADGVAFDLDGDGLADAGGAFADVVEAVGGGFDGGDLFEPVDAVFGVDVAGVDDEVDALEGGFDFGGWFGAHGGDVGVGDEADFHAGSFQAVVVSGQ